MKSAESEISQQAIAVNISKETEERFWAKVDKNGPVARQGLTPCWMWTASKLKSGYGQFPKVGRLAHRASWMINSRQEIPKGSDVMHECDNPSCVNPEHLNVGTRKKNMEDCSKRGRARNGWKEHPEKVARGDRHGFRKHPECVSRGEAHYRAKFKVEDVKTMRSEFDSGAETLRTLASRFGTRISVVHRIVKRKSWKHVI